MEKGENLNRRNLPILQQLRYLTELERGQHTRYDCEDRRKMPGQHCTGQPLSEKLLGEKDFLQKIIGLQKKGRHGLKIISVF